MRIAKGGIPTGTTIIQGATGSGKSAALLQRYRDWVAAGYRTDQILVLTAGARQAAQWREDLGLGATGPVAAYSFFRFIQRELSLFWATLQERVPALQGWIRPEFLDSDVAQCRMQALLEPQADRFHQVLKAPPGRIAGQIAGSLGLVSAANGLDPEAMAQRLAAAESAGKAPLYPAAGALLDAHWQSCLQAGLLDYGLALQLFTQHLMADAAYRDHLQGRYRCLLVDDLDETAPAEQAFLTLVAGQMAAVAFGYNPDGGHSAFLGADPEGARALVETAAEQVDLPGSHTCSTELFAGAQALAECVLGGAEGRRLTGGVARQIACDLRGDLIAAVAAEVGALLAEGTPPEEIAIIAPYLEPPLVAHLRHALAALPEPVVLQVLGPGPRLVDEPAVQAVVALASLVCPAWRIPSSRGFCTALARLRFGLDPIRAARLGQAIWQAGDLPDDADQAARTWLEAARQRAWEPDELIQAILFEQLAPQLDLSQIRHCQQLLFAAGRFRTARERFGPGAFGSAYLPVLTEASLTALPSDDLTPSEGPGPVVLATPYGFLTRRLTARVQIWFDIASDGWCGSNARELTNPYLLSPRWPDGERWSDTLADRARRVAGARTVRALARRCTGSLILTQCSLSPWGFEQEGSLAEAFADLLTERGRV